MTENSKSRSDADKWNHIYQTGQHEARAPAQVLLNHQHLLPETGTALDLACGLGTNALLLADNGLTTYAWDISQEAVKQLQEKANTQNLIIEQRDVVKHPPAPESFDVIVVSRFLDRGLIPSLMKALRNYGLIFYQTFIKEKTHETGPNNPDYRLDSNELLSLFSPLHIIYYHEEGTVGDVNQGFRNEAMLIGQKRTD